MYNYIVQSSQFSLVLKIKNGFLNNFKILKHLPQLFDHVWNKITPNCPKQDNQEVDMKDNRNSRITSTQIFDKTTTQT